MKVAVIDMGTNTFHLIIVEVKGSEFHTIYREKVPVKIGEKGITKGLITEEAGQRALKTLNSFKRSIEAHNTTKIFATATSAIRNAKNGVELVQRIEKETGIKTRIISGLQEAEYIYFGVQKALNIGNTTSLIMDIGGGSIEFILCKADKVFWKNSFEIGGQRMMELFQKHDPILQEEVGALEEYIDENLQELFSACKKNPPEVLIGSSGTFDTLSDIYLSKTGKNKEIEATELPLTIEGFASILAELKEKNRAQRLEIPGMIPLRVDMIVVACLLVAFLIKKIGISGIRVSAYALKEGVLLSTLHTLSRDSFTAP